MLKNLLQISLLTAAVLITFELDRRVFHPWELIGLTALIGLAMEASRILAKKHLNNKDLYAGSRFDTPIEKKPFGWACILTVSCSVLIMGILCLYTSVGDSHEVSAVITDKRVNGGKGGLRYSVSVEHDEYGVTYLSADHKTWESSQEGDLVLLTVNKNYLGYYVVKDFTQLR